MGLQQLQLRCCRILCILAGLGVPADLGQWHARGSELPADTQPLDLRLSPSPATKLNALAQRTSSSPTRRLSTTFMCDRIVSVPAQTTHGNPRIKPGTVAM